MFPWARKQKLAQRSVLSTTAKSCQDTTEIQSYPSSPAHSTFSRGPGDSGSKYSTPEKKLKVVLYSRDKEKKAKCPGYYASKLQNNISKSQLMNIMNSKNNARNTQITFKPGPQGISSASSKTKRPIKIKIEVNRMLDQYCRATKQILANNIWSIFGISLILLKMGFIQDLVHDRNIARQIWQQLSQPDKLGLYIFLQQVQANRVQIDSAIKGIAWQLGVSDGELDRDKAVAILGERKGEGLYQGLRLNRLARQRKIEVFN